MDKGEIFWDTFSRYLYDHYDITKDTQVIINGDRAPWIRSGVEYFESAMYTYDRYHLKKWIKETLNKDRKSTRLNSSHVAISYAVFCLKKKNLCSEVYIHTRHTT